MREEDEVRYKPDYLNIWIANSTTTSFSWWLRIGRLKPPTEAKTAESQWF
jgi:hypothetical protein